jgi:hypothetical protein
MVTNSKSENLKKYWSASEILIIITTKFNPEKSGKILKNPDFFEERHSGQDQDKS